MRWLTTATVFAFLLRVGAVTIYTTFTTDSNGNPIKPSNTNTATGPAYSGFGGTIATFWLTALISLTATEKLFLWSFSLQYDNSDTAGPT